MYLNWAQPLDGTKRNFDKESSNDTLSVDTDQFSTSEIFIIVYEGSNKYDNNTKDFM